MTIIIYISLMDYGLLYFLSHLFYLCRYKLGVVYEYQKKFIQAQQMYKRAIQLDYKHQNASLRLGQIYFNR